MIPVPASQLINFDISQHPNRKTFISQFIYCDNNAKDIKERAEKVYNNRITPNSFVEKIYCDFQKLEKAADLYKSPQQLAQELAPQSQQPTAQIPGTGPSGGVLSDITANAKQQANQYNATLGNISQQQTITNNSTNPSGNDEIQVLKEGKNICSPFINLYEGEIYTSHGGNPQYNTNLQNVNYQQNGYFAECILSDTSTRNIK